MNGTVVFQSIVFIISQTNLFQKLPLTYFKEIEEEGHEGCGFIDEDLLWDFIGRLKKNEEPSKESVRCICIQVRIFIPSMGIYKGMLMKKRCGRKVIELPTSMKKVEKSIHLPKKDEDVGYVLINRAGKDPSSYNKDMDNLFNNPDLLRGKFEVKSQKDMIKRLLKSCVSENSLIDAYFKKSRLGQEKVSHAYLRGVIVSILSICHYPGCNAITNVTHEHLVRPFHF